MRLTIESIYATTYKTRDLLTRRTNLNCKSDDGEFVVTISGPALPLQVGDRLVIGEPSGSESVIHEIGGGGF